MDRLALIFDKPAEAWNEALPLEMEPWEQCPMEDFKMKE